MSALQAQGVWHLPERDHAAGNAGGEVLAPLDAVPALPGLAARGRALHQVSTVDAVPALPGLTARGRAVHQVSTIFCN